MTNSRICPSITMNPVSTSSSPTFAESTCVRSARLTREHLLSSKPRACSMPDALYSQQCTGAHLDSRESLVALVIREVCVELQRERVSLVDAAHELHQPRRVRVRKAQHHPLERSAPVVRRQRHGALQLDSQRCAEVVVLAVGPARLALVVVGRKAHHLCACMCARAPTRADGRAGYGQVQRVSGGDFSIKQLGPRHIHDAIPAPARVSRPGAHTPSAHPAHTPSTHGRGEHRDGVDSVVCARARTQCACVYEGWGIRVRRRGAC
jgi:hypothetical protein